MLLGLCFRTDASWNESGYSNPEFDRLLVEAEGKGGHRRTPDGDGQVADNSPGRWSDHSAGLPLDLRCVPRSRVKNFTMHPTNFNYFKDVWIEG